ncbi:MAG: SPFH/Band 7/PHB domain protein [Spirochaetales bacterium]|jgi:regulator of protease activity HflC (stomatin/prohibitin superfamily)|nr:SPFH/Band 7/PHB domain protein [Spirochaetales bacterium]
MGVGFAYVLAVVVLILFFKLIRIVPEQEAWIVERFGKFEKTLGSGLHLVVPIVQKIAYKHLLKEEVLDVDPQVCITSDNVQVTVDGILYLKVMDPVKAAYGIDNYRYATAQLAKTTMRSQLGRLELDRSFSERDDLNDAIVRAVDEASDPWGIKVTRYEIKDISPTQTIEEAMKQQMRAEREKRAEILSSEGDKEARINVSKGERQEAINLSMGEKRRRINEAEGRAKAIEITAEATAEGIRDIASAIRTPGGDKATNFRIAEQFIAQFGNIIKNADTSVLPFEMAQFKSLLEAVIPGKNEPAKQRSAGSTVRMADSSKSGGVS